MAKILTIPMAMIGIVGFLFVLVAFIPCENYNYIYPSIDTRFAPGFSERAFSQVTTGMLAATVTQMLGSPLWRVPKDDGTEIWGYTLDAKCSWGDFAWLGRNITFRDGQVIFVERRVYYD